MSSTLDKSLEKHIHKCENDWNLAKVIWGIEGNIDS